MGKTKRLWRSLAVLGSVGALWLATATAGRAAEAMRLDTPDVLNTDSYLRVYAAWQTPVAATADGQVKPFEIKPGTPMKPCAAPPPPADWIRPDFDDHTWAREHAPLVCGIGARWESANEFGLVCARGKFIVDDVRGVSGMKVTLRYRGGVVVFVNGVELTRANLPEGEIKPDTLAEKYPDEAYVNDKGELLNDIVRDGKRLARRVRELTEVNVPASMLAKGVNVLAVQIVRAPVNEVAFAAKNVAGHGAVEPIWSHAALLELALTAGTGSSILANVSRPSGVQVWTPQPLDTLLVWSYGDPSEKPAISLAAARNGAFSGRLVVSSDAPLRNVKVAVGDLGGEKDIGKIPASAIRVRYAQRADEKSSWLTNYARTGTARFDVLADAPPDEVAVMEEKNWSNAAVTWPTPWSHPKNPFRPGAVLPVWVTVTVPADAKPGVYAGEATVSAEGLEATKVPIRVKVADWALPNPEDYVTINNCYQSADSVAALYKVPLWSDKHFQMLGDSLALGKLVANRLCSVNLIEQAFCMGNAESMVRWIDKGDGKYDYDFTIFDRYLDLFAAKVGKPKVLALNVWNNGNYDKSESVTRLVADGKTEHMATPVNGTPAIEAFWKPVLGEVRKRLEKRGWWDVALIGEVNDRVPRPETGKVFHDIWPDGRWIAATHMSHREVKSSDGSSMPITCGQRVWGVGNLHNPENPRYPFYPRRWATEPTHIEQVFPRVGQGVCSNLNDGSRIALWRTVAEGTLQGNIHGLGRIGLDFWPVTKGERGERYCLAGGSNLGMSHATRSLVGVGKDGPSATERLVACQEGVEIREAMIFVQKAIVGKKLTAEMEKRCAELLDERARHYLQTQGGGPYYTWIGFEGSGWQERDERLYALCAELAGAAAGK